MSSVVWDGDNIIQRVGSHIEQLGHAKYDESSNDYVLWLKDTRGVFGNNKGYIRGDSFPSMKDAKQNAAFSTAAGLFHYMWMEGLRDDGKENNQDVVQAVEDAEKGKPVTESTLKEEMRIIKASSKMQEIRGYIIGRVIGLVVGFILK